MSSPRFSYGVDPETGLAWARLAGTGAGEDMLHVLETVHADPRWRPGFDAIWDCSDVEGHDVSPHEVQPLIAEDVQSGPGRDVLVPNQTLGDEILARMLAVYARRMGKEVRVRHSLDAALDLLDHDALPEGLQSLELT